MIKDIDNLKLHEATVLDCKSVNNKTYALNKYKIGSYSVMYNPFIQNGEIIDFKSIYFFKNFLEAQYHYKRMLYNELNKKKKGIVMEK